MATLITGPDVQPPLKGLGGSLHSWERGLDPWHADAFPAEFRQAAPHQGKRENGWFGLDWCGNPITFVKDGTVFEIGAEE